MQDNFSLILGIDSSAVSASCCLLDGETILAQGFVNAGLTHSRTLLPLVESALRAAGKNMAEVGCVAVSAGPGSFTGIRIGISTVKGLCFARDIPCAAVSTLAAIAFGLEGFSGYACAVMDARCDQVYTALFRLNDSAPVRLTPDRAITIDALADELELLDGAVWLCGDGALLVHARLSGGERQALAGKIRIAPISVRFQSGYGVAAAARLEQVISADELSPEYLRIPQAERELAKREK